MYLRDEGGAPERLDTSKKRGRGMPTNNHASEVAAPDELPTPGTQNMALANRYALRSSQQGQILPRFPLLYQQHRSEILEHINAMLETHPNNVNDTD